MPSFICICQCHLASGYRSPNHTCCTTCAICQERIQLDKYDEHLPECRKNNPTRQAPETD